MRMVLMSFGSTDMTSRYQPNKAVAPIKLEMLGLLLRST
jgi:hypothetical protein